MGVSSQGGQRFVTHPAPPVNRWKRAGGRVGVVEGPGGIWVVSHCHCLESLGVGVGPWRRNDRSSNSSLEMSVGELYSSARAGSTERGARGQGPGAAKLTKAPTRSLGQGAMLSFFVAGASSGWGARDGFDIQPRSLG